MTTILRPGSFYCDSPGLLACWARGKGKNKKSKQINNNIYDWISKIRPFLALTVIGVTHTPRWVFMLPGIRFWFEENW